jgi:hypothetical protein
LRRFKKGILLLSLMTSSNVRSLKAKHEIF